MGRSTSATTGSAHADLTRWLGRAIGASRVERGLSRRQLADRAGLSYPYLCQLENGERNCPIGTLALVAAGLGTRASTLLARAEELMSP